MMTNRSLYVSAAIIACLLAALGECGAASGRQLLTTPPLVAQYQHCGTDMSGSYGCCKKGLICAYGNPWWSMCVTPTECPKQGGYTCNYDACGKKTVPTPGTVAQYQHCGDDVTGSYGCCAPGLICAFGNAYWSMCVTPTECPKQGGYQCGRDACGKVV